MRKTISIIGMVLSLIIVIYSFFGMGDTGRFFGIEMNIWFYRLIWIALFGMNLNGYLKENRKV